MSGGDRGGHQVGARPVVELTIGHTRHPADLGSAESHHRDITHERPLDRSGAPRYYNSVVTCPRNRQINLGVRARATMLRRAGAAGFSPPDAPRTPLSPRLGSPRPS